MDVSACLHGTGYRTRNYPMRPGCCFRRLSPVKVCTVMCLAMSAAEEKALDALDDAECHSCILPVKDIEMAGLSLTDADHST